MDELAACCSVSGNKLDRLAVTWRNAQVSAGLCRQQAF
jgi:hypothetical protein